MNMKFQLSSHWSWGLLLLVILATTNLVMCAGSDFGKVQSRASLGRKSESHEKGSSRLHDPTSGKWTRSGNKTSKGSNFTEMIKQNFLRRRKRDSDADSSAPPTDPLVAACGNVRPRNADPLRCYHCVSNTKKDKEPVCDHRLWKYLKHSEMARLRETCDLDGKFCVKIVQQKLGTRITTRGCFGENMFGPNRTKIAPRPGCIIYNKGGYRTTLCLCDRDFCNTAAPTTLNINASLSLFFLFTVVLNCFVY